MQKIALSFLVTVTLCWGGSTTVSLTPTNACLRQAFSTSTDGNYWNCLVGTDGAYLYSYLVGLDANFLPTDGITNITSATLNLYVFYAVSPTPSCQIQLLNCTSGWSESTATWDNQPASGTVISYATFSNSVPFSVSMDVTAEVNRVWSSGLPLSLNWGNPVNCQGGMEIYTIYAADAVGASASQLPYISITYDWPCNLVCLNGGVCATPNSCNCSPGYSGPTCNETLITTAVTTEMPVPSTFTYSPTTSVSSTQTEATSVPSTQTEATSVPSTQNTASSSNAQTSSEALSQQVTQTSQSASKTAGVVSSGLVIASSQQVTQTSQSASKTAGVVSSGLVIASSYLFILMLVIIMF